MTNVIQVDFCGTPSAQEYRRVVSELVSLAVCRLDANFSEQARMDIMVAAWNALQPESREAFLEELSNE